MHFLATLLRGRLLAPAFVLIVLLLRPALAQSEIPPPAPDIAVIKDQQIPVSSGVSLSLGEVQVGSSNGATLGLILRNFGDAPLSGITAMFSGANAADFTLSGGTLPATLGPGVGTPLTITFRPAANGARVATLSITSNDPDPAESPFLILVSGTGIGAPAPGPGVNVITFPALPSRQYGAEAFDLGATASSGLPVTYRVTGPATLGESGKKLVITGAGTVKITAAQSGGSLEGVTYPAARTVRQTLIVTKAALTLTVAPARKLRGQPLPAPVITYSGFIGGDTAARIATPPVRSTTATDSSPAGTYPFTLSGGTDPNYTFTIVPATLRVLDYAGAYEAFLTSPDNTTLPVARLAITVDAAHKATGKLADGAEGTLLPFKTAGNGFALDPVTDDAVVTVNVAAKPTGRPPFIYDLSIRLSSPQQGAPTLSAKLKLAQTLLAGTDDGRLIVTKNKTFTIDALTLLLDPAVPLDPEGGDLPAVLPLGSGYALGKVNAVGRCKLSGYLADGAPITADLYPDAAGRYRLFALPYNKRPHSYLAGRIEPVAHPDLPGRRYVPADSGHFLFWAKSADTKDKAFRTGFGAAPLVAGFTLDPWLPPSKRAPVATLVQRLGLATNGVFFPTFTDFGFDVGGANPLRLPTAFLFDARERVLVSTPGGAPKTTFAVKPESGEFRVSVPSVKLTMRGAFRQAPSTEPTRVIGAGWSELAAPSTTAETRYGDLDLKRPATANQ